MDCPASGPAGRKALAAMYEENRGRLRRMVELRLDRRLVQRVDASDVLQEAFVDVSKRLDEYLADPSMPADCLDAISSRPAAVRASSAGTSNAQKRDPRREEPAIAPARPTFDSEQIAQEFSASMTSPSEVVQRDETARRLQELLDSMDPIDREILVLRHFEELTNAEVAAELGLVHRRCE